MTGNSTATRLLKSLCVGRGSDPVSRFGTSACVGKYALWVMLCAVATTVDDAKGSTNSPDGPLSALDPKPATFATWGERLDYIHVNVPRRLMEPITWTDQYFATNRLTPLAVPPARFRMGINTEARKSGDWEYKVKPTLDAEVELPNLERRMRLFLESSRRDELPHDSPFDDGQEWRLGLRRVIDWFDIDLDAGVQLNWYPDAFVRASWERDWEWLGLHIMPHQRIFYDTDDRIGELTSLGLIHWPGARDRWMFSLLSSLKWTERRDGEWEETVQIGWVQELIEEERRGGAISRKDFARGYLLRYSMFGEGTEITQHEAILARRAPLYGNWLYWQVGAGVAAKDEYEWETGPVFRLGLDGLFWGTPER